MVVKKSLLYLYIIKKRNKMKIRRRIKSQSTEKSKHRFSQQKVYVDKDGKRYFYEGKYRGVFNFITRDSEGNSGSFNGYESDMDNLQLQIKES